MVYGRFLAIRLNNAGLFLWILVSTCSWTTKMKNMYLHSEVRIDQDKRAVSGTPEDFFDRLKIKTWIR